MSACLALEQPMRIAYLGPAGTFSHAAVAKHFGKFVARRAVRDDRRGVSRGRRRADRLCGGAGREFDRGRRRPHARSHVPDAALDLRRDQAARAAEPAVERRGARRHHARLFARAVACAVRAVARAPSARGRARRRGEQRRGGAARRARSRAPPPSRARIAAAIYGLAVLAPHIEDEPNNTTRFWVLGSQEVPPSGPRRDLARDVGAEPPGRRLRAARADRHARRQHVAPRIAAGAHRPVGVPVLRRPGRPRDRSAGGRCARANCEKKPRFSRCWDRILQRFIRNEMSADAARRRTSRPVAAGARVRARHRAATSRASRSTSSRANSGSTRATSSSSRRTRTRAGPSPAVRKAIADGHRRALAAIPTATASRSRPRSRRDFDVDADEIVLGNGSNDVLELVDAGVPAAGRQRRLFAPRVRRLSARHAGARRDRHRGRRATRLRPRPAGDARGDHADDARRVRRQSEQSDRHVDRARRAARRSSRRCRTTCSSCWTRRTTSTSSPRNARRAPRGRASYPQSRRLAHVLEGLRARRAARRLRRHEREGRRDAESRAPAVQRQRARAGRGAGGARRRRLRRRKPRAQPRGRAVLEEGFAKLGPRVRAVARQFRAGQGGRRRRASTSGCCEQGVIVRPVANYGLPEWLRVTVGLADGEPPLSGRARRPRSPADAARALDPAHERRRAAHRQARRHRRRA